MSINSYSSEGYVLSKKKYREADRIIVVFSRKYGKLTLLAKGVRKPTSKKRGHLEIFSRISFSAVRGKGFDILTEAVNLDSYRKLKKNLNRVALGYYFSEVVNKITREGEENNKIFDLLKTSFEKLQKTNGLKKLRYDFVLNLLSILGYWPEDKYLADPDSLLSDTIERSLNSVRVGKRLFV